MTRRSASPGWTPRAAALALLALLALGLVAPPIPVRAAPAVRLSATASFGGNYRQDEWVPVTVLLENAGEGVTGDVVARTARAQDGARYFQRVELPTGSKKALTVYVLVPNYTTEIEVGFTSGKDTIEAAPAPVRALKGNQRLVGVIGDDARAAATLASSLLAAYGSAVEAVAATVDDLPANPYGLGSLSALVLDDASTGRLSEEQRRALAAWVARGGQLVVAGGPSWRKTFEGLGDLPPVRARDSRSVGGLAGLGQLAGGGSGPPGNYVLSVGDPIDGAARLAEQDGQALVATRGWGKGAVTYLAFDPGAPGFLTWSGAGPSWKRLGLDAASPAPVQSAFTATSHGGAPNVDYVLRDLPSLQLPPTWLLILVMLGFIAIVGPVNYLILRRLDRRELGWLTIPALTLLFAAGIYGAGAATKGGSVVVNTVSVVLIAPGARAAEVQSFYGVFTPTRGTRQLPLGRDALLASFDGDGIGAGDLGGDVRFEQGPNAAVRDAAFSQWALRSAAAQAVVDPAPLALRLELRNDGSKVVGRVTNTSGQAVEDAVILLNGSFTRLGNIAAGATVPVDWTPPSSGSFQGGVYGSSLGSALYPGTTSGSRSSRSSGAAGHRASLVDALSGSVLASRNVNPRQAPAQPRATPGASQPPSSASTVRIGQAPLQVLYWRPDAPLPLDLGPFGGQSIVTTLVIQEVYLGGPTQDRPVGATNEVLSAES